MRPRRVAAVIAKESKEIARDPITVWIALLMPLVMLFIFGYAISLDVEDVTLGILDQDQTRASRALAEDFGQSDAFRAAATFTRPGEVEAALQRGAVRIALVIPPGFQARLGRGEGAQVQLLVDGTHPATAGLIGAYAETIAFGFGERASPAIQVETRVWYNPALRSVNFIVPGLFGVILMAFPPLLTALAITREKESGSIEQIFASPLTAGEFLLGKLVPYGLIAFVQIVMVMTVGFLWFAVPLRGSLPLLLGAGLIYVFTTVGIGLLVSTIARTQLAAMLLALIITLMPSLLFSGFLFPIFTMAYFAQLYARTLPAAYFVDLSRSVVLRGAGLPELWPSVALLLVYTLVVFALAVWRFRKKVA
jgi:ABC-2 type transport system permease protein